MSVIRMVKSPKTGYLIGNSALKQTVKPSPAVETKVYEAKAPNRDKDTEDPNLHHIDDEAIAL